MSEERSSLSLFTIATTVVGIVVLTQNQQIGLTIIFGAILLFAGVLVRNKLRQMGAEAFAVGSIIVWTGFFLSALPVIAFAWDLLGSALQIVLFISGLFLIFVGFTTNYYDLNMRLLAFLENVRSNLTELLQVIRMRLFRSVWTISSVIFTLLAIVTLFVESFNELVPNYLGVTQGPFIEFLVLGFISLGIEFRSVILLLLRSISHAFSLLILGIWRRIRNLPRFIYDSAVFLGRQLAAFVSAIATILAELRQQLYLASFVASLVFGIWAIVDSDQILGASSIVLLLIGLINLLSTRPEAVANRVAGIQQSAYRRSFSLRNLVQQYSGTCPRCEAPVNPKANYCPNCGLFIPDCMVCMRPLYRGEDSLTCSHCKIAGHAEHLERWLSIKSTCPNCREEW